MEVKVKKAYRTKNIVGLSVRDPQHEHIGAIEELVIDLENGQVAYAVLSFGGILGFGEKLFAIPWNELTMENEESERFFVLETTREKLQSLPGFNPKDWPDTASADWQQAIDEHYATTATDSEPAETA